MLSGGIYHLHVAIAISHYIYICICHLNPETTSSISITSTFKAQCFQEYNNRIYKPLLNSTTHLSAGKQNRNYRNNSMVLDTYCIDTMHDTC